MTTATAKKLIPFWHTQLGQAESDKILESLGRGMLSQGAVTEEFEAKLAKLMGVPYAVATTSGSVALYMGFAALGLGPGDEVLVPNRTFVATAHAAMLAGCTIRLVDTHKHDTLVDEEQIEARLTPRTKAIVAVHLNGNSAAMDRINAVAKEHGLPVIEDAAQGFYSRNERGFLGTQSAVGCFSLGVTKFMTTGQGGALVTRDKALHERLIRFRSHGVVSTFAAAYEQFGFNLKFNDVLASIGLAQLDRLEEKVRRHKRFYAYYREALAGLDFIKVMRVYEEKGNIPLWVEAVVAARDKVVELLKSEGIQTRPFLPDLDKSPHLGTQGCDFPNSRPFAAHGVFLPCGPDMPDEWMERTIAALKRIGKTLRNDMPKNWELA